MIETLTIEEKKLRDEMYNLLVEIELEISPDEKKIKLEKYKELKSRLGKIKFEKAMILRGENDEKHKSR